MSLTASESILSRWAALGELSTALAQGVACLEAQGLWGSSRALVVSAFVRDTDRPVLYLSPGTAERHRAAEDIRFFRDTLDSARIPVLEFPPAEPSSWHGRHRDHVAERALVCHALVTGGAIVVPTTPGSPWREPTPITPCPRGCPGRRWSSSTTPRSSRRHRRRRPPPCLSPRRSIASSGSSCRSFSAEVGVCRGSPWPRAR